MHVLTFICVGGVDFKIKVGAITELGEGDNVALHFKYRQTGAIKCYLRGLFLRLELEENRGRHCCAARAVVLARKYTEEPVCFTSSDVQDELSGGCRGMCVIRVRAGSDILSASRDDIIRGRASNVQREL